MNIITSDNLEHGFYPHNPQIVVMVLGAQLCHTVFKISTASYNQLRFYSTA